MKYTVTLNESRSHFPRQDLIIKNHFIVMESDKHQGTPLPVI